MDRARCAFVAAAALLALWGCGADHPLQPSPDATPEPAALRVSNAVAATCDRPPCAPGFGGGGRFTPPAPPFPGTVVFSGSRGVYGALEGIYVASAAGSQKLAGPVSADDPAYGAAAAGPPYYPFSRSPAWSPDGTRVAFESTLESDEPVDIVFYYAMASDGSLTEISSDAYAALLAEWEAWGIYQALPVPHQRRFDDDGDGVEDEDPIDGVDNDGDGQVDEDGGRLVEPRTQPAGTVHELGFLADPNIWIADADGTGLEQVTTDPGYDGSPAWSPDGTLLAFFSDRGGVIGVWLHDLTTGEERNVVQLGEGTAESFRGFPALSWSPDATRLTWSLAGGDLYVASLGGAYGVFGGAGDNPTWSPDGTRLAVSTFGFVDGGELVPAVGLVDAATGSVEQLRLHASCPCAWTGEGLVVIGAGIQHIDLQGNVISTLALSGSGLPTSAAIDRLSWRP